MRYAMVTPYYKESRALLERCIDSVKAQTVPTDHIMVADGFPQDWIDGTGVRHIRLDRGHSDFGNTPRGIGSMLAIGSQYDGFGLLDADNWLEADHVAACVETFGQAGAQGQEIDYVVARRYLRRPDESILPVDDEPIEQHVDTNCFFFFPGAYHITPYFGTMPRELSPLCDRIFYQAVRSRGLQGVRSARITVNYHCLWRVIYESLGETPPPEAKPNIDSDAVQQWINGRSARENLIVQRLSGLIP